MGSEANDKAAADPALARLKSRCVVTLGWTMLWVFLCGLSIGNEALIFATVFAGVAGFQTAWLLARIERLIACMLEWPG